MLLYLYTFRPFLLSSPRFDKRIVNLSLTLTSNPVGNISNTQCDFESPSICGFTQEHGGADKFDWSRDNQGTSSVGTGPTVDHTLGTANGWFNLNNFQY